MNITYENSGPIKVINPSNRVIMIAGIECKPGETDMPSALKEAIKKHPILRLDKDDAIIEEGRRRGQVSITPEIGISVIIPNLNRTDKLLDCCKSVLRSSFTEYEVIIVDDGSDIVVLDTIKTIASLFREAKIGFSYIYSSFNYGIGSSRNAGVKISKYDLILMLDSDDLILPHTLMMFSESFEETGADVLYGNTIHNGNTRIAPEWKKGNLQKFGCYILGPRCIYKKAWNSISGCREDFTVAEDLDLLIRIEKNGGVFYKVNETIGIVMDHEERVTKTRLQLLSLKSGEARMDKS